MAATDGGEPLQNGTDKTTDISEAERAAGRFAGKAPHQPHLPHQRPPPRSTPTLNSLLQASGAPPHPPQRYPNAYEPPPGAPPNPYPQSWGPPRPMAPYSPQPYRNPSPMNRKWKIGDLPDAYFLAELERELSSSASEVSDDESDEVHSDPHSVNDGAVDVDVNVNVLDMPVFWLSPGGTLRPFGGMSSRSSPTPSTSAGLIRGPRSRTPPIERPVSPVSGFSSSSRSPSFIPLTSPLASQSVATQRSVDLDAITGRSAAGRGRGSSGAGVGRGAAATRAGFRVRGRGRGRRTARQGIAGERGWRLGDMIVEACVTDENVPAAVKDKMHKAERSARVFRSSQAGTAYEDDVARALFDGDREAMEFNWASMDSFAGRPEEFLPENPGPVNPVASTYDAFRTFWDDSILEHIVCETNRYATGLKVSSDAFAREWYDTNVHEIMILFAFWMLHAIIPMPSIKLCFSRDHLLKQDSFTRLFTKSRYENLTRALHFVDNAARTKESSRLFSFGPLLEHLNTKFQEAYVMEQKIAIDESLTLWKGNLSFRQFIRTKAARFGIKSFEICESATGYLWSFEIYTGKDTDNLSKMLKSTDIVVRLMRPLLNRGHMLFMDNWFNSPVLSRFLKLNKTDCVGTLRKSRKNVSPLIQHVRPLEGTFVARHSGDVVVMAYQDKKTVYLTSTCHGTEVVQVAARPGRPSKYKPLLINEYNHFMGAVDKKDQMLEPYLIERKRHKKWYNKMFKRLLNASVLNACILYRKCATTPVRQQAFRICLVNAIMDVHLPHVPQPRQYQSGSRGSSLPSNRLVGRNHFPCHSPLAVGSSKRRMRNYCVWCLKRENTKKQGTTMCEACNVPLCLEPCFKNYHTVE